MFLSRFVNSLFPPCLVSLLFTHVWVCRVGVSTRAISAISVPADFHHPITITQLQLICDPIYTHPWSPLIVRSFWLMSVSEILCCSLVFLLHVPASCSCLFSVSPLTKSPGSFLQPDYSSRHLHWPSSPCVASFCVCSGIFICTSITLNLSFLHLASIILCRDSFTMPNPQRVVMTEVDLTEAVLYCTTVKTYFW